ncbi:phage tail spike protein [Bacillus thuringiensis]|nr:phage tail spike protein [Bacillus thuringiensis]
MRTPSGILHVVDFKTDQIVAAIQPQDYWDDKRHWEIKNNVDMLDFTVFDGTTHSATLQQQNLVLKEVRDGRVVPYVITEAEKNSGKRSITTYASGAWVQIAKSGIIKPQRIEGKTVNEFIDMALTGMKWKRGKTDYAGFHTMTIDEFIDPLTFLKKIASLFKLEIQYRVEIQGSQIIGWYVDMIQRRGRDTGKEIELGKDLIGVTRIEHSRDICTALVGFVKGEGDNVITIDSINRGLPYIVDSDAFQRWNERGKHKFGFYTPETEELDMTPKRLMTLMEIELKKRVNSSVSYEVEAQSIGRIFGLAHELINEGDTIRIKDTGFTPKLYLEARVIAGDESFTDPTQDKYVFGDYREITDPNEELRKIYNRILSSLGSKQELIDQLDKLVKDANETASNAKKESEAAKTLAEKVQENLKNNTVDIIEAKNPPTTGLKSYKTLWRDISNGKPGVLKIWTGAAWESVVPDVESVKKETLEQVNKDIESAKTELNQKVQSVEGKAQEIAGQIVDVQKQVNGKVDQTWINTQLKDKADKSGVFTKEEINNGFIGKQIYETDKNGNVKKFRDINTSMNQTNEALKQKAEKSELTKTNEGLSQLEQKANEIKTTAEGTKQTLTELKTQVDNTKLDGRNSLKNSNFSSYIINDSISWDKSLNGNLQASGCGSGYNGGVADPTKGYHAHLDITTFGYPVVAFINKNSIIGQKNRWMGIAEDVVAEFARNNVAGKEITISMDIWSDTKGFRINGGIHHFIEGNTAQSFHSGQYVFNVSEVNRWERYAFTMKLHEKFDVTKAVRLYIYGGEGIEGTAYVKNVKLELANVATAWTPAPEDQVTTTDFTKKTVEIETTIKGINTSVSNIQNEQGKLTERVTKSEQTADGFKQSIESLTKKDNDISNKLNTVEQTVEGTKKTISDVQKTTTELKETTTDIKEEAGKISTKLEQVEARAVGGENCLINTGPNERPQTIGMIGGAVLNKVTSFVQPGEYVAIECQDHTDAFYQFHLDNTKIGEFEKGKDITISLDLQNDVLLDFILFQYINGSWSESVQKPVPAKDWRRESWTFKIDVRAIGWGFRIRFARNEASKGKRFRFKKTKLEKGSVPTDFSKSTYELEQSVDGVKSTVSKVQDSQAGFEKRMTTVEQTATGLSTTVSNLNNVVSDQGKKLTDANSKLEQQATAIGVKVELKQVEDYVAGFKIPDLKNTVNQNKEDLLNELANKLVTEQFNQKMTLIDNRFSVNEKGIDLAAKKTEVYTKLQADGQFATSSYVRDLEGRTQVTEKNILSTVKNGEIISAINQTAETIKISAGKIQLDGTTIAKYLEAQELKGTTIRTDNGSNYVHIQKQFIRLMESNLNRMFIGYYKRAVDSQIQPTILMHDDVDTSRFRDGTLTISQFPVKGENYYTGTFGIVKGYDADQTPHYCAKLNVDTKGDVSLNGDNYIYITGNNGVTLRSDKQFSAYTNTIRLDSVSHVDILTGGALFMKSNQNTEVNSGGHTIITSGKGISQYAKNGSYWVEVANGATFTVSNPSNAFWVDSAGGITLKGGSKSVWMDSQSSIVFNLKGKNMLDIVATSNAETDLRFQTVTLRNGNVDGYKTLQVKDGTGNAFNAVTASAFQTASKREYKTNIRDVQFSAIEKIMALQIQQYNLKTDIEDLYEKRMNCVEGDPILTTNDIETHYGWIADDKNTPGCFVTKERNAAELYSSVAIQIKAFQEEKQAKDAEIQELKKENKQMNSRIEVLEQLLLQNLIDKKPEQP